MVVAAGVVATVGATPGEDFSTALERAREAAAAHRYQQVIDLLEPFNNVDDPEVRYITAAEIGRAHFHLGQYRPAHSAFRQAVALRPQLVEAAVYLQATSFLLGDRVQALTVFESLLQSGARDLYLAVTLAGERRFLADPGVRTLLERHTIELDLDVARGAMRGVAIGAPRDEVIAAFEVPPTRGGTSALSAAAGPAVIWAFAFDCEDRLREMAFEVDHMMRYTPYRIRLAGHPGWQPTPASTLAALGPPDQRRTSQDGLSWGWRFEDHVVTMEFSSGARSDLLGLPQGAASLGLLEIVRAPNPDRMPR